MTIWLYTETETPLRAGPFASIVEAMASDLWEWWGVCCWIERKALGGWEYENVVWNGCRWVVTSHGKRPAEPMRPEMILEAADLVAR